MTPGKQIDLCFEFVRMFAEASADTRAELVRQAAATMGADAKLVKAMDAYNIAHRSDNIKREILT